MSIMNSASIEKLNKENYRTWKIQMEAILVKNDLWEYVDGTAPRPTSTTDVAAWEKKDRKARADIILAMSSTELNYIKNCTTSHDVWNKLSDTYESKGPARKATLLKQLLFSRMSEEDDMTEHINKFTSTVDKLKELEITVSEDIISILLL